MCSSGLEALSCPFSTKYFRSTDLRLTTSPAIATYTLLPTVLLCLPWFVGLFVAPFFIVFCRAVGHFFKFLFSWAGTWKLFCRFWSCGGVVRPANVLTSVRLPNPFLISTIFFL